jgi:modification methylase
MRSDWEIPVCTGKERLKIDGSKAHTTQKPEALLYRVILSSSNPGEVILDPFFGTGTTGAVASKLHRHWVGIEQDEQYVRLAQARLDALESREYQADVYATPQKRKLPRIPFGTLLQQGLIAPGQELFFGKRANITATVLVDGQIKYNGYTGSIHQVARAIQDAPCNGWEQWYYLDEQTGEHIAINRLREVVRQQHDL